MELGLKGKHVIVTGGGTNIGRAIVHAFAAEGSRISIAELVPSQGEIVAEEGPATTAAFLEDEEAQKASQSEAGMTLVDAAEGDAEMAGEKLAPFWESWAEENGPEYVEALATVREAIGK